MTSDFKCTQGGFCCELHGGNLQATRRDIEYWKAHKLQLLEYVDLETGALWQNPEGGTFTRCPWLSYDKDGRASCGIYSHRPEACMQYPNSDFEIETICIQCNKIKNSDTRMVKVSQIASQHDSKQDLTVEYPSFD